MFKGIKNYNKNILNSYLEIKEVKGGVKNKKTFCGICGKHKNENNENKWLIYRNRLKNKIIYFHDTCLKNPKDILLKSFICVEPPVNICCSYCKKPPKYSNYHHPNKMGEDKWFAIKEKEIKRRSGVEEIYDYYHEECLEKLQKKMEKEKLNLQEESKKEEGFFLAFDVE